MTERKKVLAINDLSCAGRISLSVVIPILSVMGVEVYPLPSALLSTHTAYSKPYFKSLSDEMLSIIRHWEELNISFDAIYCGFLGNEDQIKIVKEVVNRFKRADTFFLLDPCMADNGKLYKTYNTNMVNGIIKLCKTADLITPNLTEACILANQEYCQRINSIDKITKLIGLLTNLNHNNILLTGVDYQSSLVTFVKEKERAVNSIQAETKVEQKFFGAGDIFSSVTLGGILNGLSVLSSAKLAIDFLDRVIKISCEDKRKDFTSLKFEGELGYLINSLQKQKTH